ncbi:hypothetical protein LJ737_12510 [Hymenobacter sp. 15J16-1T3B]|uniref:hypothetical protein n=1 Tax=Hymenobacter sp. 15J16-1T3B TaxID=2886941 RepID=UPI001D1051BA|nr:hypothetical protein [Hymenobacter sp. 15J16-1T3B]MCC3158064.1 hypothetical protein [Hymenobacter sp. 15J16-1T3B]
MQVLYYSNRCCRLMGGLSLLALSSCCDCFDESIDHLRFKFDADSLGQGFRQEEVRGAYLIRYTDSKATHLLDTVRQSRRYPPASDSSYFQVIYIPGAFINYSFRLVGNVSTPSGETIRSYRVVVPAAGVSHAITDIDVVTRSSNLPLSCGCQSIKHKSFLLNGEKVDLKQDESRETVLSR